jgi:hypothetical protein
MERTSAINLTFRPALLPRSGSRVAALLVSQVLIIGKVLADNKNFNSQRYNGNHAN